MKKSLVILLAALPLIFCSCFSSKTTYTYVLDCDFDTFDMRQPRVMIKNLIMPGHLDTTQIMERYSDTRIGPRRYQQWGVNFQRMVKNALTNKVAKASVSLETFYTADVLFNRFEIQDGQVVLDAICNLRSGNQMRRSKRIRHSFPCNEYIDDELVAAYNQAIATLATEIVALAK